MYYKKKLIMCITVLVLTIILAVCLMKLKPFQSKDTDNHSKTNTQDNDNDNDNRTGIEQDDNRDKNHAEEKESTSFGDLMITPGVYDAQDNTDSSQTLPEKTEDFVVDGKQPDYIFKPYIDWSNGMLNEEQLHTMADIAAKLYEQFLNAEEVSCSVSYELPSAEDLEKFKDQVYYFIDEKGVLSLNLKLFILDDNKMEEQLRTISVQYNLDVVELLKEK